MNAFSQLDTVYVAHHVQKIEAIVVEVTAFQRKGPKSGPSLQAVPDSS